MRVRLALVPGEPAGIGPELCVRLAQRTWPADAVVFADPDTLEAAAERLGLPLAIRAAGQACGVGELAVEPLRQARPTRFGTPDAANSPVVHEALQRAGQACLDGHCSGLVTGPVHKATLNAAGIAYIGTTELLAEQAGVPVVMMLANPTLRVALATTHLPLRNVADAITRGGLETTLGILHDDLRRRFGIAAPRIAVLGLNPH